MGFTLVNFHIPKTAGSTFLYRLFGSLRPLQKQKYIRNVTKRSVLLEGEYYDKLRRAFEIEQKEGRGEDFNVLTGHFRFREVYDLIESTLDDTMLVTFLRDPVARVISDYYYSISPKHDQRESFLQAFPSFERYLEFPEQTNKQASFLEPFARAPIEDTIENVREKFGFVGCTERFDEDYERLVSALAFPKSERRRQNENPNPSLTSEALRKYRDTVYDCTEKDRKLYKEFCAQDKIFHPLLPPVLRKDKKLSKRKELLNRIEELAPWHHKIHLTEDIWTGAGDIADNTGSKVSYYDPLRAMRNLTRHSLPDGFEGRSFLDCACNGGGYSFAAKDMGASRVFGFDVRQHWIDQCQFVMENRDAPIEGMEFRQADLLDLSFMDEEFDVTWFSGLFYHLPDPVAGLKNAADRTKELIFVNTAVVPIEPDVEEVPSLEMQFEGTQELMSGIYRLSWSPSGPKVMRNILNWMGFADTRLIFWHKKTKLGDRRVSGRLCIVGAREKGRLDGVPEAEPVDLHTGPMRQK